MMTRFPISILTCALLAACSGNGGSGGAGVGSPSVCDAADPATCTATIPGADTSGDGTGTADASGTSGGTAGAAAVQVATTRSLAATSGLAGGLISASYDAAAGTFNVIGAGRNVTINRFALADNGAMLAMRDATGIHNAYFGEGSGTQVAVYSGGTAGNVAHLAAYGRTGTTDLPTVGSGQFNGDYAGFTNTRRINGDVTLSVDFAAATIEGTITGRELRQRPDNVFDAVNPLATVRLEQAAILQDGSFAGTTGGGQIVGGQQLWNPATGTYAGLIGGAVAGEAVGTLAITHQAPNGGSFDEVGGFLARR